MRCGPDGWGRAPLSSAAALLLSAALLSHGGGKKTAEAMGVPFLGELPLDPAVRIGGDSGQPITLSDAGAPFVAIAREVQRRAAEESRKKGPSIKIEE